MISVAVPNFKSVVHFLLVDFGLDRQTGLEFDNIQNFFAFYSKKILIYSKLSTVMTSYTEAAGIFGITYLYCSC